MAQVQHNSDDLQHSEDLVERLLDAERDVDRRRGTLNAPSTPPSLLNAPISSQASSNEQRLSEKYSPSQILPTTAGDGSGVERNGFALLKDWWWELASMAFSIGCLAGVIGVLIAVHRKSLEELNWWMFSPNTHVAIFNTFAKSSMLLVLAECISQLKWIYFQQKDRPVSDMELFDYASRGPLGSLKLLWSINGQALVGSGCAVLTLLALAMDPFAQQILRYSAQEVILNENGASLPYIRSWLNNAEQRDDPGLNVSRSQYQIHAIYSSLLSSNAELPVQCYTGNCTWSTYRTLGLCSECVNVTDACEASRNVTIIRVPEGRYGIHVNYTTPMGVGINARFAIDDYQAWGSMLTSHTRQPKYYGPSVLTGLFMPPQVSIARFPIRYLEQFPARFKELSTTNFMTLQPPHTYDCKFHYCETTRLPVVTNSKLDDRIQKTSRMSISGVKYCRPGHDNTLCGFAKSPENDGETYAISANSLLTLVSVFENFFNSYSSTNGEGAASLHGWEPRSALWWPNHGNISKTMQDMAESVTTFMRQGPASKQHMGSVKGSATIVTVQWIWLTLPIMTVITAAVLLAICIRFSTKTSKVAWKSSALALLFHGLSGWDQTELDKRSVETMKEQAKNMSAKLCEDDNEALTLVRY